MIALITRVRQHIRGNLPLQPLQCKAPKIVDRLNLMLRDACKKRGGFYLASIGGSAANLAEHCIKKVEC
jgi:hypothetical protein